MSGPKTRVSELVPMSSAIARPISSRGTTSPSIARRTGNSTAHSVPATNEAASRCQYSIRSVRTSAPSTAETAVSSEKHAISITRRSTRSASVPMASAKRIRGTWRVKKRSATRKADPVRSKTKTPSTSVSSQRIAEASAPVSHSRRKLRSERTTRTGVRGPWAIRAV